MCAGQVLLAHIGLASEATQLVMESAGGLPGSLNLAMLIGEKGMGRDPFFLSRANLTHFAVASPLVFGSSHGVTCGGGLGKAGVCSD